MPRLLSSVMPQRSYVRRILVPVLAAIALICGPLAAVPAQAAPARVAAAVAADDPASDVRFHGTVVNADGDSLDNIEVRAYDTADNSGDSAAADITYGGEYSLYLPPGSYTIKFTDSDEDYQDFDYDGGAPQTLADDSVELLPVELSKAPRGMASGTVQSGPSAPISGADVQLVRVYGDDDTSDVDDAGSGDAGDYSFDSVIVGKTYTIRAAAPGYKTTYLGGGTSLTGATTFTGAATTNLSAITLAASSEVHGVVSDVNGPIDAGVTAFRWDSDAGELVEAGNTDAQDGVYALNLETPGLYTLYISPQDNDSVGRAAYLGGSAEAPTSVDANFITVTATPESFTKNITLPTADVATGSVKEGSNPLGGVKVRLYEYVAPTDDDEGGWDEAGPTATSKADGTYKIKVDPGTRYTLRFSKATFKSTYLFGQDELPAVPSDSNSFVPSSDTTPLSAVTMIPRESDLGKVAGQNLAYCKAHALQANDDESTDEVTLPFELTYFGESFNSLYVNNNGNVTFGEPRADYTPADLTGAAAPIIAPFFADIDTTGDDSNEVTYGASPDGKTFCVNWADVGYFPGQTDKLNTVQLLLTSRTGNSGRTAGDFDITFNYDKVVWETGEASDGVNGFGGTSAAAGYSAGTGDPGTYFQLPGSLVNGALLDSGPNALISGKQNSTQDGRYIFEIRNEGIQADLGSLHGLVKRASNNAAVSDAYVEACRIVNEAPTRCYTTQTSASGAYAFSGVRVGSYSIDVSPPGDSLRGNGASTTVTVGNDTPVPDILLSAPTPIPDGSSITNVDTQGGVPVVYYQDPLTLKVPACSTGTSTGTWKVTLADGTIADQGTFALTSDGKLTATIPALYPNHGDARITTAVSCNGVADPGQSPAFDIYIDPSGTVLDQFGAPVQGAAATLLRSDAADGDYAPVPDGSNIMSAGNRANPTTTNAEGFFGWDVIAGWYRVQVSKDDCTTSTTDPMEVPPERIDLIIKLACTRPAPAPTTAPLISGDATVGSILTVSAGTYGVGMAPTGTAWLRDGVEIPGASTDTYQLAPADQGKTVTAQHTVKHSDAASNLGDEMLTFTQYTVNSSNSKVVPAAAVVTPPPPPAPLFGASFSGNVKGGKKKATVSVKVRFSNVKTKKVKGTVYVWEGARMVKRGSFKKGKGSFKFKAAKGVHTYTVVFNGGAAYGTKSFAKAVRVK